MTPVEDTQQILIVPVPILEDELLEECISAFPIAGSVPEQPLQVVEIGGFDPSADLVGSLQMPGESKEDAKIVL